MINYYKVKTVTAFVDTSKESTITVLIEKLWFLFAQNMSTNNHIPSSSVYFGTNPNNHHQKEKEDLIQGLLLQ